MQKIVAGNVTHYFIDTVNPTGYPQMLAEERTSNFVDVGYIWGLDLIFRGPFSGAQSYYIHDGHGSVRALTSTTGAVTDTYDYDAYGNLLRKTGTTANNYLFADEQFDPNLNLYYNRARYLSTTTGRFWSMDSYEGRDRSPISLHKYLYASDDPVTVVDRNGTFGLDDVAVTAAAVTILAAINVVPYLWTRGNFSQGDGEQPPSAYATSTNENSIEIYNSHWNEDQFFQFMSSFRGVNDGDVGTLSGAPVSGEGQKITFTLRGALWLGQAPFSVKSRRYDSREHVIAAVTLQGHPLRGYRYWRVFSPDHQPGHFVLETGALDEPGPGPLDGIRFLAGQSAQLRIWQEYLQDALHLSGGSEGFDPSYDFPFGVFGFPDRFEVLNEVTGVD